MKLYEIVFMLALLAMFCWGLYELGKPVDRTKWCISCQETNHYFCRGERISCSCPCAVFTKTPPKAHDHSHPHAHESDFDKRQAALRTED